MIMVRPSSTARRRITSSTSLTSSGSSAEVGSSSSSTLDWRNRARDRDALLLAAGQMPRQRVGAMAEADAFEQFARALIGICP